MDSNGLISLKWVELSQWCNLTGDTRDAVHNQVGLFIDTKQIAPPAAGVPITKLLGDQHGLFRNDFDLIPQQTLYILSFSNPLIGKGRLLQALNT